MTDGGPAFPSDGAWGNNVKDCRTCAMYRPAAPYGETFCRVQPVGEKNPCILGSRYERAEFRPLWRTE